jgi:hypothetical protein
MPLPKDRELYEEVKLLAGRVYRKPSAYKSGFIVKKYKELGGTYEDDHKTRNLKRWFQEEWADVGHRSYPVYRPTRRVSRKTPLTASEIDEKNLKEQIRLKQKIKGDHNLPPFKKKKKNSSSSAARRSKLR